MRLLFPSSLLFRVRSCGAEGDADPLSYPAGGEQLLGEGTVEGVEPGLPVPVVGERPRFVVQQHADAAVLGVARQGFPPAIVPGAELMLVQLQAPGQFIHTHHAPLALLLPGDGLVGYLSRGGEERMWVSCVQCEGNRKAGAHSV